MRNILLAATVAAALLAAWLWLREEERAPAPPPAPPPARVEAPVPDAATPPRPEPKPAPTPAALPNAGFCSADEGPTSITIRHTLEGLLRRSADDKSLASVLREALDASDARSRLEAVRRARRLKPRDPALGWELAALTRSTPDVEDAIDGLTDYLSADPNPELLRLRALLEVQRDIQKGYSRVERGGTTVLFAPEALTASQADDVLDRVNRFLDDAARLSGTPRRSALTVVVYPGRSELLAVTCVRSWTAGVYDGTLRLVAPVEPKVLQHETLHAQVSKHASAAPRWFHEGLAQSFANQTDRRARWGMMVKNRTYVPFSSLDGTFQAFEASEDAALAYTQSYAMVELMRDCGGDAAVSRAIDAFQRGDKTEAVLMQACGRPVTGNDLLDFMAKRLSTP